MNKKKKSNIHYQKALKFIKKNNVTEAVKELKLCLKFNPQDLQALNLLALGYYLKCRFDKAEKYWRQSLTVKRKNNQAVDYLELITKKDFRELRQEYQEIIFNDTAAKSEKIDFLKDLIKKHDQLIEPYLILGLLYKEAENYQEALKYLYQAYDLDSGNKNIKNYIMEAEKKEKATNFFNFDLNKFKIFKNKKETAVILTAVLAVLLIFYLNNGEPLPVAETTQPAEITEKKETEKPKAAEKTKKAEKAEKEAKNKNDLAELNLNLDLMNFKAGGNPLSLDLIREIRKKETEKESQRSYQKYFKENREQELFNLGLQAFRNQRYQDAAAIFKQLYQFAAADYLKRESLYLLARSSHLAKNYQKTERYYRIYINRYPDTNYYPESLYNLALFLDKKGETEEAQKVIKKLRADAPYSSYNNSKAYDILKKES